MFDTAAMLKYHKHPFHFQILCFVDFHYVPLTLKSSQFQPSSCPYSYEINQNNNSTLPAFFGSRLENYVLLWTPHFEKNKKKTFARNNGWVVEGLRAMTYEYYLVERKVAQPGDEWHKVIWRIMNERKRLKFLLWSFYGHVAETGYRCSEMRNKHIVFLGTELKLYFPAILTVRWGCVIDFWSMV